MADFFWIRRSLRANELLKTSAHNPTMTMPTLSPFKHHSKKFTMTLSDLPTQVPPQLPNLGVIPAAHGGGANPVARIALQPQPRPVPSVAAMINIDGICLVILQLVLATEAHIPPKKPALILPRLWTLKEMAPLMASSTSGPLVEKITTSRIA